MCVAWGLQMVSLLHMAEITEEGVRFQSGANSARMLLTPEHSIAIQNRLGLPGLLQDYHSLSSVRQSARTSGAGVMSRTHVWAKQARTSSWPWMMWFPACTQHQRGELFTTLGTGVLQDDNLVLRNVAEQV